MEKRNQSFIAVLIGIAVLAATVATTPPLALDETLPVVEELPVSVGDFAGTAISFCLDLQCPVSRQGAEKEAEESCAECGKPLSSRSAGELAVLPADTILLRRKYENELGEIYQVSIVVSGVSRKSLHNPQMCLKGMGYQIGDRDVVDVSMDGVGERAVHVTEVGARTKRGEILHDRQRFVYWYVAPGHHTTSRLERTWLMARDNVLDGVSRRWAYVTVMSRRADNGPLMNVAMSAFIGDLYPLLIAEEADQ